jgi:hypothetical protein
MSETRKVMKACCGQQVNRVLDDIEMSMRVCSTEGGVLAALDKIISRLRPVADRYMCVVCHMAPVDVHAGYDTCTACANRI